MAVMSKSTHGFCTKLCYGEEIMPITLLFIYKGLKVLVQLLVYSFGLPI